MDARIQEGMTVYSADGEKLGRVVQLGENTFLIEKGFFFPKDYLAQYGDIGRVADGDVYLSRRGADLREASDSGIMEPGAMETGAMRGDVSEEVRIPLVEEEVDVEKRTREAGQVRIRKEVVTEEKQVTVPVTREEVTIETAPVSDARAA